MNNKEKKIFFYVFAFNLLIFIFVIALIISAISMVSGYFSEYYPVYSEQSSRLSEILMCIIVLLSLAKIKPLYVNTKKTTLNYLEKMKDR